MDATVTPVRSERAARDQTVAAPWRPLSSWRRARRMPMGGGKDAATADRVVRAGFGVGAAGPRGRSNRPRAGARALPTRVRRRRPPAEATGRRQHLTGRARRRPGPSFLFGASDDYLYGPPGF